MTDSNSLTPLPAQDYEAIEAAVMETARGRWFLAEYAKRHRSADTEMLLGAIHKLEKNLKREGNAPNIDAFKLDIADMASAIERTKEEISQIVAKGEHGGRISEASNELDAIVEHTESATQEILNTAETVQELCFEMREAGGDEALCDRLEEYTTNIYMACSFQDLTGQRTQKVVHVLRYLENRVNAMIRIWDLKDSEIDAIEQAPANENDTRPDAHLLNGPQMAGQGADQDEIDTLMANEAEGIFGNEGELAKAGFDVKFDVEASPDDETEAENDADPLDEDGACVFTEDDFTPPDDLDLASFEAEALEDPSTEPGDVAEEVQTRKDEHSALIVEDDLDFADADLIESWETEPIDVTPPMLAEDPDSQEAGDEVPDIFDLSGDVSSAMAALHFAADTIEEENEVDEFEGADVFETSGSKAVENRIDEDPTLELTAAERLALFQ